jgi:hypothetical protein
MSIGADLYARSVEHVARIGARGTHRLVNRVRWQQRAAGRAAPPASRADRAVLRSCTGRSAGSLGWQSGRPSQCWCEVHGAVAAVDQESTSEAG